MQIEKIYLYIQKSTTPNKQAVLSQVETDAETELGCQFLGIYIFQNKIRQRRR